MLQEPFILIHIFFYFMLDVWMALLVILLVIVSSADTDDIRYTG